MMEILFGAICTIFGAIITIIINTMQTKTSKSISFSDVITRERINSVNTMRNMIANLCTLMYSNKGDDKDKILNYALKIKMLITIHYEKEGNVGHYELEKELNDIIENYININVINVKEKANNMIKTARFIFDYEWNRIKEEAR